MAGLGFEVTSLWVQARVVGDVDLLVGVGLCGAGCADFLGCGQYAVAGVFDFLEVRMISAMVSGGVL